MPDTTPVFRADHSFILPLQENGSGTILFIERVANRPHHPPAVAGRPFPCVRIETTAPCLATKPRIPAGSTARPCTSRLWEILAAAKLTTQEPRSGTEIKARM